MPTVRELKDEVEEHLNKIKTITAEHEALLIKDKNRLSQFKDNFDKSKELLKDSSELYVESKNLNNDQNSLQRGIAKVQSDSTKKFNLASNKLTIADDLLIKATVINESTLKISSSAAKSMSEVDASKVSVDKLTKEIKNSIVLLKQEEKTVTDKINLLNDKYNEIYLMHRELLYDGKGENDELIVSLDSQIHSTIEEINKELTDIKSKNVKITNNNETFLEEREKEFNASRKTLENKISSLLPNAATASLAHSYFDAKSRYGAVPNRNPGEGFWGKIYNSIRHLIANRTPIAFSYILFIAPIGIIVFLFYNYIHQIADLYETLQTNEELYRSLWVVFAARIFISIPLAYVSWFGMLTIQSSRRLYEEYNHKQRVMELYQGFKEELEDRKYKELQRELLKTLLEVVKDKPSLVLNEFNEATRKTMLQEFFKASKENGDEDVSNS